MDGTEELRDRRGQLIQGKRIKTCPRGGLVALRRVGLRSAARPNNRHVRSAAISTIIPVLMRLPCN